MAVLLSGYSASNFAGAANVELKKLQGGHLTPVKTMT
jgi:hypothetical protein